MKFEPSKLDSLNISLNDGVSVNVNRKLLILSVRMRSKEAIFRISTFMVKTFVGSRTRKRQVSAIIYRPFSRPQSKLRIKEAIKDRAALPASSIESVISAAAVIALTTAASVELDCLGRMISR